MEPSAPPPLQTRLQHIWRLWGRSIYVPEDTRRSDSGGDTDSVVEGETKGLVHLFPTFATVKELVLDQVTDSEQRTTCRVGGGVHAVRTRNASGERGCWRESEAIEQYTMV